MIIQCPSCKSRFSIDAEKIVSPTSKGRCSVCGHIFPLLQYAVEDMEVAKLRDRFEREKTERARAILGYRGGVYGIPRNEANIEESSQKETMMEEEAPGDQESFPPLQEELDAMEVFPVDASAEDESKPTAKEEKSIQPPSTLLEDEADKWAATFSVPDVDEEPDSAGWEEELTRDIEENLRPDVTPEGTHKPEDEAVFPFDPGKDMDLQAESEAMEPRSRGPLPGKPPTEPRDGRESFQPGNQEGDKHPWKEEEAPEVSIDEAFPQEKESHRSPLLRVLLVILFVMILAGGGWYLYKAGTLTSQGSFTGRIIEKINAIRGKSSMVLYDLKNEQEPARDGKFFAVRGMVQNRGKTTVPFVPLRIKIFDGRGHIVQTGRTVGGKVLSPEDISKMTVQNVFKTYQIQIHRNRQTFGRLDPGEKVPFLFLFDLSKFPRKTAKTFQVEILKAQ